MTTSQTWSFAPSVADLVIHSFLRCGVKRAQFTPEHMSDARMCANLLLAEWENIQPHLWTIDLYSLPLVQGTATYTLPAETILPLDVYIVPTGAGDRIVYPVSRSDYAAYPNKTQQGAPNVYWFNRQITPVINFYLAPDAVGYTAKIYRVKQMQDANPTGAQTPDLARRFLPAFSAGLAARLSEIYAPERYEALETSHKTRFAEAVIQDQENAPIQIAPDFSSYRG